MENEIKILEEALQRLKELKKQREEEKTSYQLIYDRLEKIEDDIDLIKKAIA